LECYSHGSSSIAPWRLPARGRSAPTLWAVRVLIANLVGNLLGKQVPRK